MNPISDQRRLKSVPFSLASSDPVSRGSWLFVPAQGWGMEESASLALAADVAAETEGCGVVDEPVEYRARDMETTESGHVVVELASDVNLDQSMASTEAESTLRTAFVGENAIAR